MGEKRFDIVCGMQEVLGMDVMGVMGGLAALEYLRGEGVGEGLSDMRREWGERERMIGS